MYFEKLKENLMNARLNKDSKRIELYSYLLGQVTLKNKSPSDDEIFKCIKAYVKSLKNVSTDKKDYLEKCDFEISELDNFMPKQLTDIEIKTILNSFESSDFKNVTKYFVENHTGQYNPGDLRKVWVELNG